VDIQLKKKRVHNQLAVKKVRRAFVSKKVVSEAKEERQHAKFSCCCYSSLGLPEELPSLEERGNSR